MLTKKRLEKFVRIRNISPSNSSIQFAKDAATVGFDVKLLGVAKKVKEGIFEWDTPFGILREENGKFKIKDTE